MSLLHDETYVHNSFFKTSLPFIELKKKNNITKKKEHKELLCYTNMYVLI